jgi:hypothetical protein
VYYVRFVDGDFADSHDNRDLRLRRAGAQALQNRDRGFDRRGYYRFVGFVGVDYYIGR